MGVPMTGPKILIIEDDRIIANLTELRLRKLGYEVAGRIENPHSAMDYISKNSPDLILMDIRLSDEIDGITLAEKIREKSATPIVFVTALADEDTIMKVKAIHQSGYIHKPFNDDDLRIAIELILPED